MNVGVGPYNLKMFGTTLIVLLIVFVVIFDVEKDKLTIIVGVLGTALGYLFGITESK